MKWIKENWYKFAVILFLIFLFGFLPWWLSQPVEIIYDKNAPPLWIDDDPEGGYFPRR